MAKNKIRLEEIVKKNGANNVPEELEENGIYFLKEKEDYDFGSDYNPAEIEVFGHKLNVVMKKRLSDSLLDPSEDDLEVLRKARNSSRGQLRNMFSKKKLDISQSNLSRTFDDKYINSLVMNIIKYPNDSPFEENLTQMGLNEPDIAKLYAEAASVWAGSPTEPSLGDFMGKLGKVSTWSGNSDVVDLNTENCEKGSHYVLKFNVKKKQKKVQRDVIENKVYSDIEDKIAEYIIENSSDTSIKNNAHNLIRMYLNISCLYDKDKPLPIK